MKRTKLSKMSIGIIGAIKRGRGATREEKIARFLSKYTDTPIEHYNTDNLTTIVRQAAAELFDCCEYPGALFSEFCCKLNYPWKMTEFEALCSTLDLIQVKKKNDLTGEYEYINGFWQVDDFNLYFK